MFRIKKTCRFIQENEGKIDLQKKKGKKETNSFAGFLLIRPGGETFQRLSFE